jgi:hypothetical protein
MGCRNDYMEPNAREIEASRVFACLDELDTGNMNRSHFGGNHPKAYGQNVSQDTLNQFTASLCRKLEKLPGFISSYSLELQMWWREHVEGEERRAAEDAEPTDFDRVKADIQAAVDFNGWHVEGTEVDDLANQILATLN